jgi:ABC-type amino acid transport substrate-binding protein
MANPRPVVRGFEGLKARRRTVLLAAVSFLIAGGTLAATRTDLPEIKQQGSLRVLMVDVAEEPQFFSLNPAGPPGLDHEVLDRFAHVHGLKLEIVPVPGWDALVPALLKGRGDVIAGRFTVTDARRKQIAFTDEVFPTRNVVVTRKPYRTIRTVDQLKAEKISVVKGTSMVEVLVATGVPPANIDQSIVSGGVPAALRAGKINCTVQELAEAVIAQQRDPDLQMGMFLGPPASYAYGVRKEDAQLRSALDEHINTLRRDPSWYRLVVKYFGRSAPDILLRARAE